MTRKPRTRRKTEAPAPPPPPSLGRRLLAWLGKGMLGVAAAYLVLILLFAIVPPPGNIYQWSESWRLGGI